RRRGRARGASPLHGDARRAARRLGRDARRPRRARRAALGGVARARPAAGLKVRRIVTSIAAVIVTADRPLLLADALRGVAAQSAPAREVRIGDDGTVPVAVPDDLGLLEVTVVP